MKRAADNKPNRTLIRAAALALLLTIISMPQISPAQGFGPELALTLDATELEADSPGTVHVQGWVDLDGLPFVPYRVNISAECSNWSAECEPEFLLFTGSGNQSFNVTVTVPAGQEGGTTRQLNVTAAVETVGIPSTNTTAYAMVRVRQLFGVLLTSSVAALETKAGAPVTWSFKVTNTGNGYDSFSVSVVDLQSYTSAGWVLRFNRTIVSAENGSDVNVGLNITPPPSHPEGSVEMRVRAYSRGANAYNQTVEAFLNLSLSVHKSQGGGDGSKPPPEPRRVPGTGSAGAVLGLGLVSVARALAQRSRRRQSRR